MGSICYNICLCIDLIITLKYPLYPGFFLLIYLQKFLLGKKRNIFYHAFTVLNALVGIIVLSPTIKGSNRIIIKIMLSLLERCNTNDKTIFYHMLFFCYNSLN